MAGPSTNRSSAGQNRLGFKVIQAGSEMKLLRGFPHDHKLFWNPEDKWKQTRCAVCNEPVFGHPSDGCFNCLYFVIHKSCAELPLELQVTFYSKHHLLEFEKTPEPVGGKLCSVCSEKIRQYGYSCCLSKCNFRVHVKCATSPECKTSMDSHHHRFVRMPQLMTLNSVSYTWEACRRASANTNAANAHHGV